MRVFGATAYYPQARRNGGQGAGPPCPWSGGKGGREVGPTLQENFGQIKKRTKSLKTTSCSPTFTSRP